MRWAVLVALCGCNAVFGLESTKPQPVYFDAMPDAPFRCPMMGAPGFSSGFTQILSGGACTGYTTSRATGTAVTTCTVNAGATRMAVMQSSVDSSDLAEAMVQPTLTGLDIEPELSPEGDELWVGQPDGGTGSKISVYTPAATSTPTAPSWEWSRDVWTSTDPSITVGTPTSLGPSRHVMFKDSTGALHELFLQPNGSWIDMPPTGQTKISRIGALSPPNLSPDGLRMVFAGTIMAQSTTDGVIYGSRDSIATPFAFDTMVILTGPPADAATPFLTDDCSRVYFSGLQSVFYVSEQL